MVASPELTQVYSCVAWEVGRGGNTRKAERGAGAEVLGRPSHILPGGQCPRPALLSNRLCQLPPSPATAVQEMPMISDCYHGN